MSNSKKRARKSKIEVRTDEDVNETENSILQVQEQPESQPESQPIMVPRLLQKGKKDAVLSDHTYSLLHAPPTPATPLELSVKVEVEEFDESVITTQSKHTNNTKMLPGPSTKVISRATRYRTPILSFSIDLEKMYKISEHIAWSSTNRADTYLNTEMRNIWGRAFRAKPDNDPYNDLIQDALHSWAGNTANLKTWRESPVYYQCSICTLAWWYLSPFREHIRTHDLKTLKVYHQEFNSQSLIVASNVVYKIPRLFPCEGKCYRCGLEFEAHIHVQEDEESYSCAKCKGSFSTCSRRNHHLSLCSGRHRNPTAKMCNICLYSFPNKEDLKTHMIISHSVRSDIPVPFIFKTCSYCGVKYHNFNMHSCLKTTLNANCKNCFRKFPSKSIAMMHQAMAKSNFRCTMCNKILPSRCMEPEHMLIHSNNYQMVYKCVTSSCPPTILYTDARSVKLHKVVYHKQKFDKRRSYFEMVMVPKRCVEPVGVGDMDHVAACNLAYKLFMGVEADAQKETDIQKNTENVLKDNEMNEVTKIFNYMQQSDQDFEINNYEDMLTKVFRIKDTDVPRKRKKVSDTRDTPSNTVSDTEQTLSNVLKSSNNVRSVDTLVDSPYTEIQIKTEVDFEELIDIKDEPITIKSEPIDTYGLCDQTDDICNIQETSLVTDPYAHAIKSEPQECEIETYDSLMTAVKMEPEEVKQELVEATDIKIMDTYTEPTMTPENGVIGSKTDEPKEKKAVKKNIKETKKKTSKKNSASPKKSQSKQTPETTNFALPETTNSSLPETTNSSPPETTNSPLPETDKSEDDSTYTPPTKPKQRILKMRKIYTCTKCGYSNSHRPFRIHSNSKCEISPTVDEDKYLCTKCNTSYGTLKAYVVHFQQHSYALLHCPVCNIKFEALKDLLPHFHKHVRYNFVNCFLLNTEMEQPTKKQQRCQICHEIVAPENFFPHWESHLTLISNVKTEPGPLDVGESPHGNKKTLAPAVLHIALQQLRTVNRDKECLVCHRKFSRRYDCKRHLIEHLLLDAHSKKETTPNSTFRCQICLEDFKKCDKYRFHMREHGSLPVYRCELCNKTFSDSSNFAKHKKVHNFLKLLTCDICLKKFHAKVSLERHMMMHQVTEPIKCKDCPKQFYTMSQYKKHMKVRHFKLTKFKCVLCDISFDTLRRKWEHQWAVHKERKHKADCPVCRKPFRKYHDVKNHALHEHNVELKYYNIKSDFRISTIKLKRVCKRRRHKEVPTETLVISSNLAENL